ncbi:unnamed protein product [Rhodiola kirilowii]
MDEGGAIRLLGENGGVRRAILELEKKLFSPSFLLMFVTLLDYGAGNVRSVRNAIRHLGFQIKDVQTPQDILEADNLIFPGVGAFAAAMDVLSQNGMGGALCRYIEQDRPFLGICLGLQLLFDSSEEKGPVKGLGLIPGVVGRFDSSNGFRVPHIGWNALKISKDSYIWGDIENHHVYFVHSYRAMPSSDNQEWVSSTCNYGDNFIASVERRNVLCSSVPSRKKWRNFSSMLVVCSRMAVLSLLFSKEPSHEVGLSVLKKFLYPKPSSTKRLTKGNASQLAKRVIACLDVRANDQVDFVVTKGDQYDVRENTDDNEVYYSSMVSSGCIFVCNSCYMFRHQSHLMPEVAQFPASCCN